jgi:hypothetical protein
MKSKTLCCSGKPQGAKIHKEMFKMNLGEKWPTKKVLMLKICKENNNWIYAVRF